MTEYARGYSVGKLREARLFQARLTARPSSVNAMGRFCQRAWSPYPGTDWEKEWREAKVGDLKRQAAALASPVLDVASSTP